jgi:hypothetical protein
MQETIDDGGGEADILDDLRPLRKLLLELMIVG